LVSALTSRVNCLSHLREAIFPAAAILPHIPNDRLATLVHMHVLNTDHFLEICGMGAGHLHDEGAFDLALRLCAFNEG
jgi:hypothetical protein